MLAALPYRVVAVDLAGHGCSLARVAQRRAWSIESFARDMEAVVDAAGAERLALVGHSLGGAVALETALRVGRRCRLVLGVDTFTDAAFYRSRPAPEIAERLRPFRADFPGAVAAMIARITAPYTDGRTAAWIATAMSRTDPPVALAVLEGLLAWDIAARWSRVSCPVETINSAALALPEALRLERLTVHAMAGVGHFPMLEAPARLNALVSGIFARLLPASD